MSMQVTVTLSDEVYQRVVRLAQVTQRDVADVLSETLSLSLPTLPTHPETLPPITTLTDTAVLAASDEQLPPAQDRRLSVLLERQQGGVLRESERAELLVLMQRYQEGLLRKAQALAEAVRRGLRSPLTP